MVFSIPFLVVNSIGNSNYLDSCAVHISYCCCSCAPLIGALVSLFFLFFSSSFLYAAKGYDNYEQPVACPAHSGFLINGPMETAMSKCQLLKC